MLSYFNCISRNSTLTALLFLCVLSATSWAQKKVALEVTFISNEGFLLRTGSKAVLIDALYKESHPDFTFPSDALRSQMISGSAPFNSVDIYLQSHVHYTHFFPVTVGEFLNRHEETRMIASPQVVDSLTKLSPHYRKVKKQLMPYDWEKDRKTFAHNGIEIEAFKIKHDGQQQWGWIQNLGHIIDIGDFRVLHMGDLLLDEQVLQAMDIRNRSIDLVILPYWVVLRGGAEKVKQLINAKNYIISHFPIPRADQNISSVRQVMPEAIIINTPMQQRFFKSKE